MQTKKKTFLQTRVRLLTNILIVAVPGCMQANDSIKNLVSGPMSQLSVQANTIPSLQLFSTKDSVAAGDSILVGYIITNGDSTRRLSLDPRFFQVDIIDPNKNLLPPLLPAWSGSPGDDATVTLPKFGITGRFFELSCGTPGLISIEMCEMPLKFLLPGQYKIVLRFSPPAPPDKPSTALLLISDTLRLKVYPGRGHL